ncbi:YceI family protein [Iamia sp. SCSIO 61187]|uniref:YceI family protein n=1 Tax=Iamia sp. SCSIO 61187 TaxID=2722752 RepID=UPI001C632382|nr:YceI family protein [Iamia sp. SCSIO 61187]QYG91123.1 YceI family protein [Iamia sp. SCSIO 61187]
MIKKLVGAVIVVVLVLVGVGVWYFVIRDDSVEKAEVGCDPDPCETSTASTVDGTWTVVADGSETTLAITETIGGVADHAVEGHTEVGGSVVVADGAVTEATITADMTTLAFTDAPPGFDVANRARAMERTGLETGAFPEATFSLTAPIELGDDVGSGEVVTAEATGDLTLHGVTRPVTFAVDVVADGATFRVTPSEFIPIVLADHDMEVDGPGFVADVADEGSFDFLLVLEQA